MTFSNALLSQSLQSRLNIHHYTEKDGLSRNSANCIMQDHRGFLWIGTADGLNRFDGSEFKIYDKDLSDVTDYKLGTIIDLSEDSLGRIWIATAGGLCWLDPVTDRITEVKIPSPTQPMINSLLVQDRNHLWIGSWYDVHRLDLNSFAVTSLSLTEPGLDPQFNLADCLMMLNDSILLIGGAHGIYSLNTGDAVINHDLCRVGYVLSLHPYRDDQAVAGIYGKGSFVYDHSAGQFTPIPLCPINPGESPRSKLPGADIQTNFVTQVLPDGKRNLWASGRYGLLLYDGLTLDCRSVYDCHTGYPTTEPNHTFTHDILLDQEDNLWTSSKEGIYHIVTSDTRFILRDLPGVISIYAYLEKPYHYWLIRNTGDVQLYDMHNDSILTTYHEQSIIHPDNENFTCAEKDGTKGFWIGSSKGNLYSFDCMTGTYQLYPAGIPGIGSDTRIHGITATGNGDLWLGTSQGLWKFKPGSKQFFDYSDSLRFNLPEEPEVYTLMVDHTDRVWILGETKDECNLYDPSTNRFSYPGILDFEGKPVPIARQQKYVQDKQDRIWLTSMSGMYLYHEESGQFEKKDIGIPSGTIMEMVCDSAGRLWGYYYKRLFVYNPVDSSVFEFSVADGLPDDGIAYIGYLRETDQIYLLHNNGRVVIFDPDQLRPRKSRYTVELIEFRLLGRDTVLPASDEFATKLGYRENDIRFGFKLMDLSDDRNTRYAIMLEGSDDSWNDIGQSNSAIYSNLRQGEYAFWVKTVKLSGDYTPPRLLTRFVIATPYWHATWFRILGLMILSAFIAAIYIVRVNQLKKIIRVRTKISSDLHDDIGGTLTSIRVYSEMARRNADQKERLFGILDKIEETASEMIQSMGDIVWTINPKYDAFSFIVQRMENFASALLSSQEITYTLTKENGVENIHLSMNKRKNVFLIFKEAVNNAAKHASCKKVDIRLIHTGSFLHMTIADDGIGINGQNGNTGNGLPNMQKRAFEIGGTIFVSSEKGKGTLVSVEVPV